MDKREKQIFESFANRVVSISEQRAFQRLKDAGVIHSDTRYAEFMSPLFARYYSAQLTTFHLFCKQEAKKLADEIVKELTQA